MEPRDRDASGRSFDEIVRNLDLHVAGGLRRRSEDTFERTKRSILNSSGEFEDLRAADGVIETKTSIYKIVEACDVGEGLIGDVALVGAVAFERSKHFCIVAPELPDDIAYRIRALGHAEYFGYRGLRFALATSEMQVDRIVSVSETSRSPNDIHADDARYWVALAKVLFWIAVTVAFYIELRVTFRSTYVDLLAVAPFWFKAFYGTSVRDVPDGEAGGSPKWRLVHVNSVVAPTLALLLIFAITTLPAAIVYLACIAIAVDVAACFSAAFARNVVRVASRLPSFLR